jgi:AraC-like DNA-binding protein
MKDSFYMFDSAPLNTIVLLGSIQGFILTGLLWGAKKNKRPNRFLAILIFLMALTCLNLYCIHQSWYDSTSALRIIRAMVPMVIVMPLGPLIYFYTRSFLERDFTFTKKHSRHFYSVGLDLLPYMTAWFYIGTMSLGLIPKNNAAWGHFIDTYNTYVDIPRWVSLSVYLFISARYLSASARPNPQSKWLLTFLRLFQAFQCLWLLHLIPYLIPRYSDALLNWGDWYPLYIPMAIIIYWLGIRGYLLTRDIVSSSPRKPELPEAAVRKAVAQLKKSMEEDRVYLDANLNLTQLSGHTGVNPKIISAVINQHFNKNFNEYINEYRISALRDRLSDLESENLTIVGLAYECGFNSQSTFQRAFKAILGVSPKEYLAKIPVKS